MNLLSHLRRRAKDAATATDDGAGIKEFAPLPPVTPATIALVEKQLSFQLPPLLIEIYTTVANGGVGPGYGLFRIHDEPQTSDLVESYCYMKGIDAKWKWPDGLVPLFSHGCGQYECVDCTRPDGPMIWHNPDYLRGRSVPSTLAPLAESLRERLMVWIRGEDLIAAANEVLRGRGKR